jgi:hypothetical protein
LDQTGTENGPRQSVHRLCGKSLRGTRYPVKRVTEAMPQKILLTSPDALAQTNVCVDADFPADECFDSSALVLSFSAFHVPVSHQHRECAGGECTDGSVTIGALAPVFCSRDDMALLTARENDRRARMEVEANQFASLLLIPPPVLRKALERSRSTPCRA